MAQIGRPVSLIFFHFLFFVVVRRTLHAERRDAGV